PDARRRFAAALPAPRTRCELSRSRARAGPHGAARRPELSHAVPARAASVPAPAAAAPLAQRGSPLRAADRRDRAAAPPGIPPARPRPGDPQALSGVDRYTLGFTNFSTKRSLVPRRSPAARGDGLQ